jgi:hypothetical protein
LPHRDIKDFYLIEITFSKKNGVPKRISVWARHFYKREELTMTNYVHKGKIQVAQELYEFINSEALPESGVDADQFWSGLEVLISDLTPKNNNKNSL